MKIIIPMAGMGTRMRPHTLTIPKPLIKLAGKSIVERLIERITNVCNEKIEEVAFIIGDFGDQVEKDLKEIAIKNGAEPKIYYQHEPLGTGHAIWCASQSLQGKTVIAFADTLFYADFSIKKSDEAIIWVKKVENPSSFGVVSLDKNENITGFVEKPQEFVSDLAIIGIYYFKNGEELQKELQYLMDNNITRKGEYEITSALEKMRLNGLIFKPGKVQEWLDCGNKEVTIDTHTRVLQISNENNKTSDSAVIENSTIIEPCYIADKAKISNSVIGPNVSIGNNTKIDSSVIKNSIIQDNTEIKNSCLNRSMIGNSVKINNNPSSISLGDYNEI
jgi:glucose-1-phosphate thymidylyltransferase